MANNYTFIDAASVVQTADTSIVGAGHQPLVIVSSIVGVNILGTVATNMPSPSVIAYQAAGSVLGIDISSTSIFTIPGTAQWIQGTANAVSGTSVQAIAPQGTSIFTYITGVQVANASANNVYLTFTGGLGGASSVLGYTVAPANGGSNIYYPSGLKTGANSGFSVSVSGVASIYVAAQGFISKT